MPNGGMRHYTPSDTARYENIVALAANQAMAGVDTTDDPVWVDVVVTLQVPKSWDKRKTEGALAGAIKPTSKPDLSNVLKSIEDGMTGIVYYDDSQIVTVSAMKRYGSTPEVLVTVRW